MEGDKIEHPCKIIMANNITNKYKCFLMSPPQVRNEIVIFKLL